MGWATDPRGAAGRLLDQPPRASPTNSGRRRMVIDRDPGGGEETDVANSDDTTAGSFGVLFVPRVVDGRTRGSEIQRATAQFSRVVPSRACTRAAVTKGKGGRAEFGVGFLPPPCSVLGLYGALGALQRRQMTTANKAPLCGFLEMQREGGLHQSGNSRRCWSSGPTSKNNLIKKKNECLLPFGGVFVLCGGVGVFLPPALNRAKAQHACTRAPLSCCEK